MSTLNRLLVAALMAAAPALACAWTYGPGVPPGYGYGYPPPYPYPGAGLGSQPDPQAPARGPLMGRIPEAQPAPAQRPVEAPAQTPAQTQGQTQAGPPATVAPGSVEPGPAQGSNLPLPPGPPRGAGYGGRPFAGPAPLRVEREIRGDAYLVRIRSGDGTTADIQATPTGRGLAISRGAQAETQEEQSFDEGRGYRRSFSFSQGRASRFLSVPRDADLSRMTREDKDGEVILSIPRLARGQSHPGLPQAPATQLAPPPATR